MTSAATHIDVVKFGWGTSLVTADLGRKIACLRDLGIGFYFGGTLFEKFVVQDRFDGYLEWCRRMGRRHRGDLQRDHPADQHREGGLHPQLRRRASRSSARSDSRTRCRNQLLSPTQWVDEHRRRPRGRRRPRRDRDPGERTQRAVTGLTASFASICSSTSCPAASTSTGCSSKRRPRTCRPSSCAGSAPTSTSGNIAAADVIGARDPPAGTAGRHPAALRVAVVLARCADHA